MRLGNNDQIKAQGVAGDDSKPDKAIFSMLEVTCHGAATSLAFLQPATGEDN